MGWWHGHLLKDRIRALHEEWQRRAFALDGDLESGATKARRSAALALVEPVLQRHLPEEVRREYEGLAAGCGLPVRTLLLTEMLTDVLRFTEKAPRLLSATCARSAEGAVSNVNSSWSNPWAGLLAPHWTWITRRGAPGARGTTVLAWPGSLGGVLAARADGLVALAGEADVDVARQGLAGPPFRVSLRRAHERADTPDALLAALARTTAHHVLAVDLARGSAKSQEVAFTGEDPVDVPPPPPPRDELVTGPQMCAAGCVRAQHKDGATWLAWLDEGGGDAVLRVP
jgi:hypothetical protein